MAQHQIEATVAERERTTRPSVFYWVVTVRRARLEPLSRNRDGPDGTFLCGEHSFSHTHYSRNSVFVRFNVK